MRGEGQRAARMIFNERGGRENPKDRPEIKEIMAGLSKLSPEMRKSYFELLPELAEGGGENPEQALINARGLLEVHQNYVRQLEATQREAVANHKPVKQAMAEDISAMREVFNDFEKYEGIETKFDTPVQPTVADPLHSHHEKRRRPKGGMSLKEKPLDPRMSPEI